MRRLRQRAGVVLLVALALFGTALWGLRSGWVAKRLEARVGRELYEACRLRLSYNAFEISPLFARLNLFGLKVSTEDGTPLLYIERAYADLSLRQLLRGRIHVQDLLLEAPQVELRIDQGRWVDAPPCLRADSAKRGSSPPLGLHEVQIQRGRARVSTGDTDIQLEGLAAALGPQSASESFLKLSLEEGWVFRNRAAAQGVPIRRFQASAYIDGPPLAPEGIDLESFEADVGGVAMSAYGRIEPQAEHLDLWASARAELGRLPEALTGGRELSGGVVLRGHLQGSVADPKLEARAELRRVRIGRRHFGRRTLLRARIDRRGVDLTRGEVELARGRAELTGRLDFRPGLPLRVEARTRKFSFAALMDALGNRGVWVDFAVTGKSQVKGKLSPFLLEGPFDFKLPGLDVWRGPWDDSRAVKDPKRRILDVAPMTIAGRWRYTASNLRSPRRRDPK